MDFKHTLSFIPLSSLSFPSVPIPPVLAPPLARSFSRTAGDFNLVSTICHYMGDSRSYLGDACSGYTDKGIGLNQPSPTTVLPSRSLAIPTPPAPAISYSLRHIHPTYKPPSALISIIPLCGVAFAVYQICSAKRQAHAASVEKLIKSKSKSKSPAGKADESIPKAGFRHMDLSAWTTEGKSTERPFAQELAKKSEEKWVRRFEEEKVKDKEAFKALEDRLSGCAEQCQAILTAEVATTTLAKRVDHASADTMPTHLHANTGADEKIHKEEEEEKWARAKEDMQRRFDEEKARDKAALRALEDKLAGCMDQCRVLTAELAGLAERVDHAGAEETSKEARDCDAGEMLKVAEVEEVGNVLADAQSAAALAQTELAERVERAIAEKFQETMAVLADRVHKFEKKTSRRVKGALEDMGRDLEKVGEGVERVEVGMKQAQMTSKKAMKVAEEAKGLCELGVPESDASFVLPTNYDGYDDLRDVEPPFPNDESGTLA